MEDEDRVKLKMLIAVEPLLSPTLAPSPPDSPDDQALGEDEMELEALDLGAAAANGANGQHLKKEVPPLSPKSALKRARIEDPNHRHDTDVPALPLEKKRASVHLGKERRLHPLKPRSSDEWKKVCAAFQSHGRTLKRRGDELARSSSASSSPTSAKDALLSLALTTDAILLYAFSFWADDCSAGRFVGQGWASLLQLLGYVSAKAAKAEEGALQALCARMESHVLHLLVLHSERKVVAQLATPATPAQPHPTLPELNKLTTKHHDDLVRSYRRWEYSSASLLAPRALRQHLPDLWAYVSGAGGGSDALDLSQDDAIWPLCDAAFAWPVELQSRGNSMTHAIGFYRAALADWARSKGLEWQDEIEAVKKELGE